MALFPAETANPTDRGRARRGRAADSAPFYETRARPRLPTAGTRKLDGIAATIANGVFAPGGGETRARRRKGHGVDGGLRRAGSPGMMLPLVGARHG